MNIFKACIIRPSSYTTCGEALASAFAAHLYQQKRSANEDSGNERKKQRLTGKNLILTDMGLGRGSQTLCFDIAYKPVLLSSDK